MTSSASFFREEAEILKLLSHCETRVEGDSDSITCALVVDAVPNATVNNDKSEKGSAARPEEFVEVNASANRVIAILETYQEQPGILDASLEAMIAPIMRCFRSVVALHQKKNRPTA